MFERIRHTIFNNSRGFTLIELLAVMAIVGVLAGIVTTAVSGTSEESRDAQVAQDAGTVFNAATEYFTDQDGVGVISTDTQDVVTETAPDQVTNSLWPEDSFGVSHAYAEEFPISALVTVADVQFVEEDGTTTFQNIGSNGSGQDVTLAVFVAEYTAVDFNTLVTNGYMDVVPDSAGSLVNSLFNKYLWVFEKSTTPEGSSDDTRDVLVFKMSSATVDAGGLYTLVYKNIR